MNTRQLQALRDILCGKRLGKGAARTVYECRVNQNLVIKIAKDRFDTIYQNINEYQVWYTMLGTAHEKYFAPVYELSNCGLVLEQARTHEIPDDFELPSTYPKYVTDLKRDALGLYEGRVVIHDYGLLDLEAVLKGTKKINF